MNNYFKNAIFLVLLLKLLPGQSLQEIQRLQNEYKKVLEMQSLQKPKDIADAEKTASSTALPDKLIYSRKDIESLLVNTQKLLDQLQQIDDSTYKMPYIGYDFFVKRDSIPFWQNLPLSNDYLLGPGDEIIISLWGESSLYENAKLNRDGQIFINNVGMLNLGGKTISGAKNHIISKFSRVYSTLIGSNPKSYIDVTIGELKSINVHFVGFVNIPGVHLVHPFSNVINGLIQAGGVDIKGSLREIQIIRKSQVISITDLYSYLLEGKPLKDIRLNDQDIIYVPPRKSTIPLTGRVLNPGFYETISNETLNDLISYAGGKERFASEFTFLFKNNISNNSYIVKDSDFGAITISQGDSIHVPKSPQGYKYIELQGQLMNPGKYPFKSNLTLKDALNATMSLNNNDFSKTMDLSNINIYRKNAIGEKPIKILTAFEDNIKLMSGDHINIPKKNINQNLESVILTGQINIPGRYPVNNLTSLDDIINQAGGLTNTALDDGIEIFRDSLKIAWNEKSFILRAGDSLNVLKKTGLILIEGEVNNPGFFSYNDRKSIKKYLNSAGGFSPFADKKNIFITYPNGTSAPLRTWSSPKITEGATITVGMRTLSGSQQLTGWQVFSTLTSQAGNIATTLLSLSIILNQNSNAN